MRYSELVLDRQAHDLGFFDRPASSLMGSCDDEVRQRATLNLRGSPEQLVDIGG
jgi:hypothetical protein